MGNPTVTVEIPAGNYCMNGMTPCVFASYSPGRRVFNCRLYGQLLKDGKDPQKCRQCKNYCHDIEKGEIHG